MARAQGLVRTAKHYYSMNGGPLRPGITSALDMIAKPPLIGWAKYGTADAAIANVGRLRTMISRDGPAPAKAWLAAQVEQKREDAAEFGSTIHALTEALDRGERVDVDAQTAPYLEAWQRFVVDHHVVFRSRERYVLNETVGFGGTYDFDALLGRRGIPTLGDLKTGKNALYPETRLQLVGLRHGEFTGRPGDGRKYRMPRVRQLVIVHVAPEDYERGYQVFRVDETEADWRAVQAAVALKHWKDSKPATGTPLEPS